MPRYYQAVSQDLHQSNKGVSIYSPETGWEDRPFPPEGSDLSFLDTPKERAASAEVAKPTESFELDEWTTTPATEGGLALVGDSLERLFQMLEQGSDSSLQTGWQEVVELCREIDESSRQKEEALRGLKALNEKIASDQSKLMSRLEDVAERQRKEVESAQIRAELSAAVANVIQKKFSSGD